MSKDSIISEEDLYLIGMDYSLVGSYYVEAIWDTTTNPPTLLKLTRIDPSTVMYKGLVGKVKFDE